MNEDYFISKNVNVPVEKTWQGMKETLYRELKCGLTSYVIITTGNQVDSTLVEIYSQD